MICILRIKVNLLIHPKLQRQYKKGDQSCTFTSMMTPPPACLGSVLATGAEGVVVTLMTPAVPDGLVSSDFLCQ